MEINNEYLSILKDYANKIADLRRKSGTRLNWDEYFLSIATTVASRGTCLRRGYGAVIVDPKDNSLISTGYCGNAAGTKDCLEIGKCFREEAGIPSGFGYDLCDSLHGEGNAILIAGKKNCKNNIIYVSGIDFMTNSLVSGKPCDSCESKIINAGLEKIIYLDEKGKIVRVNVSDIIEYRNKHPLESKEKKLKVYIERGLKLR